MDSIQIGIALFQLIVTVDDLSNYALTYFMGTSDYSRGRSIHCKRKLSATEKKSKTRGSKMFIAKMLFSCTLAGI